MNDETDPIAKKLGVETFPSVVGLSLDGDQFSPEDKQLFDKPVSKTIVALKAFLEKLIKMDVTESSQEGPQEIKLITRSNMKQVCGPDAALCIIAVLKSSKHQGKAKQILTEVGLFLILPIYTYDTCQPSA